MRKTNFYLSAGLLFFASAMVAKQIFHLSEFISGFLLGLGITFQLVGILAMRFNIDISRIKKTFLNRFK
jgi:predicted DNA repair protein MutK